MTNETPETPDLSHLDLTPLPGSERSAAPGSQPASPQSLDPNDPITITVILRRRAPVPDEALGAPDAPRGVHQPLRR